MMDLPVQMLQNIHSWEAIGYEVKGNLVTGENVQISRPPQNSPNNILEIYEGKQELITSMCFSNRNEEIKWISNSIVNDINQEKVKPEQIIVISLDAIEAKNYMAMLQALLFDKKIISVIPGVFE